MFKYQILDKNFKTKHESETYVRNYLKKLGYRLISQEDKEFKFISCLMQMTPDKFELTENKMYKGTVTLLRD